MASRSRRPPARGALASLAPGLGQPQPPSRCEQESRPSGRSHSPRRRRARDSCDWRARERPGRGRPAWNFPVPSGPARTKPPWPPPQPPWPTPRSTKGELLHAPIPLPAHGGPGPGWLQGGGGSPSCTAPRSPSPGAARAPSPPPTRLRVLQGRGWGARRPT